MRYPRTDTERAGADAALREALGPACPGCGAAATDIDHDHETGEVRGLLCSGCNRALGCVADRPDVLERLRRYLLEPPAAGLPDAAPRRGDGLPAGVSPDGCGGFQARAGRRLVGRFATPELAAAALVRNTPHPSDTSTSARGPSAAPRLFAPK